MTIRALHEKLDRILRSQERIEQLIVLEGRLIMSTTAELQNAIDADTAAVTAQTSVVESAVTLLNGFQKRIDDAIAAFQAANPGVDVSPLVATTAALKANTDALAAAVAANTPAAPPAPAPAPDPAPAPTPDPTPSP